MNLPPPDHDVHSDGRLMHDLSALNTRISQYILRYLDAEARRAEPISVAKEQALADKLAGLAKRVEARAKRRAAAPSVATINGATQPNLLEPGSSRTGDMDNGP